MRTIQLFNDDWMYVPDQVKVSEPDDVFQSITLPHSNILFSDRNVDNEAYQFISTYRKHFTWMPEGDDRRVFLDFDGVMLAATAYLNGRLLGEHLGGYAPFSMEVTDDLIDGENTLNVYVDSRERTDIPPYGYMVDYLTFGGIYRDVYLRAVPKCHIDNVFIRPHAVLDNPRLEVDVRLNQTSAGLRLKAVLKDQPGSVLGTAEASATQAVSSLVFEQLPDVDLWTLDQPTLYAVEVSLLEGETSRDLVTARFGFREAEFRSDEGFYLNGQRLDLFGLNRHQTYPYIGAAAPARLQRQDADILKNELGCNIVRTSHYPQSPHFLNRCDEIGLLVFEEMTGWQHIGDDNWKAIYLSELETVIERDRNHPSIILWGVRVNESGDDDDFYTLTNALAHKLDSTRQTGGVRFILNSSFLEDVFTYNDFSGTVIEPTEQPHLITEFAGHMFPTKTWDGEERLIDHALLHTHVQNLQMGNSRVAGAIGWAAFDYSTHIAFGSGDRICHHGVMDMFRLPKWAARFYESQQSPDKRVVLAAATRWTMGDRSGGGMNPVTVFSNCDEIEVTVGDRLVGRFSPDRAAYPNLPHPPFAITGLDKHHAWGRGEFFDLQIVGYIDGKAVAEQRIAANGLPHQITIAADDDTIVANGADMTRVVLRVIDEFGNPLPYSLKVVQFEISGDADLIGENPFPLVGGQGAVYVRAGHSAGTVTITATTEGLDASVTTIELIDAARA